MSRLGSLRGFGQGYIASFRRSSPDNRKSKGHQLIWPFRLGVPGQVQVPCGPSANGLRVWGASRSSVAHHLGLGCRLKLLMEGSLGNRDRFETLCSLSAGVLHSLGHYMHYSLLCWEVRVFLGPRRLVPFRVFGKEAADAQLVGDLASASVIDRLQNLKESENPETCCRQLLNLLVQHVDP